MPMVRSSLVELHSIEWKYGPYDLPCVTVRSSNRAVSVSGPSGAGGGQDEMFGLAMKVLMMDDRQALTLMLERPLLEGSNYQWWVQMQATTSDLGLIEVSLTRGEKIEHQPKESS